MINDESLGYYRDLGCFALGWSGSGSSQRNKPLESRLRQTADSSREFLKIENEHLKTV